MKNRGLLKSLFLSTALIIGGVAKGQIVPQSMPIIQTAPVKMSALYIAGPEYDMPPANDEERTYKEKVDIKKEHIAEFNTTFKNSPRQVVGNGERNITIKGVQQALYNLPRSEELFILVDVHGNKNFTAWENDHGDEMMTMTNGLALSTNSADLSSSYDLYSEMASFISEDPDLADTKITIVHLSCSGAAAVMDFPMMPKNTAIITMSTPETYSRPHLSTALEHIRLMSNMPYDGGKKWGQDQQSLILSFLATSTLSGRDIDKKNYPIVTMINDAAPDSVAVAYTPHPVQHEHKEALGFHGAKVTDYDFLANNLLAIYTQEEIYAAVEKHTIPWLDFSETHGLLYEMKNNLDCKDVTTLGYTRTKQAFMVSHIAEQEYGRASQALSKYATENNMIKPITTPKSQFPVFLPKF